MSSVPQAVVQDVTGLRFVIATGSPVQMAEHVAVESLVDHLQDRQRVPRAPTVSGCFVPVYLV